mmetsp:Transcript_82194/g.172061  ORF Transcript_82194/g.172061 Transcript_82194/m.172061 type:complete len:262 (-) Transcript_82194:284-1069(-)|eukprot:CAMPEP_0206422566 /NCGR_PEP_ID=MMETSP0324_2-20121206/2164_1 /ASSEMBLY_ACC=CAM_ASM_000836 /TAXON_ID=2866 /ORGANISM="Crypthecodinium cohnii, Strain Seligo" /LENGTH=261 /DNA_ID=CAMNT_0053886965 /DNA_START=102 /DNA_END=887 /DNA_ORIENTATION=-
MAATDGQLQIDMERFRARQAKCLKILADPSGRAKHILKAMLTEQQNSTRRRSAAHRSSSDVADAPMEKEDSARSSTTADSKDPDAKMEKLRQKSVECKRLIQEGLASAAAAAAAAAAAPVTAFPPCRTPDEMVDPIVDNVVVTMSDAVITELETSARELEKENKVLTRTCEELTTEKADLTKELAKLRHENARLRKGNEQLTKENTGLKFASATQQLQDLAAEIENSKKPRFSAYAQTGLALGGLGMVVTAFSISRLRNRN